ncbi:sigma-70 family RNA polymerase sigma factor [Streptomyces sp. NRRL WC-3742]|uniref:sigma-70 family RNA polymerase sigma factor n=1 Tax=Streptomyces sp. NRRL WC-3742 TaxID=1463934 RepID=UPI0007C45B49|nr:sigma-70 family RNA polymerase sigma factor [Streptomyces sp. NRRL WC-3742]
MAAPDENPRWDEQLQRRLARGEETALGELYDRLSPMVHGLAGRVLGDQAAAAQLTREIFAHVWEHPEEFDPAQGSLRSWLGALTHRRAVDRLRAARAAEFVPAGAAPTGAAESAAEEEIRTVATAARMQYVVDSLPGPLRETIAVTYYDGRTYQETARLLGISEQAAKQRMRLGLDLLATELAAELAEERARHGDDPGGTGGTAHGEPGDAHGDGTANDGTTGDGGT